MVTKVMVAKGGVRRVWSVSLNSRLRWPSVLKLFGWHAGLPPSMNIPAHPLFQDEYSVWGERGGVGGVLVFCILLVVFCILTSPDQSCFGT